MTEGPSGGRDRSEGRAPTPAHSIGRYLASQRRLRGISLDELAARTRIPRRNLERLESGAFDAKPDGFVRGFVRTVAEALGLDPHEAVMRLAEEPSAAGEERLRAQRRRAALAAALLLALVLIVAFAGLHVAARWAAKPDPDPAEAWVYRRDSVRSLAEGEARADAGAGSEPAEPEPGAASP